MSGHQEPAGQSCMLRRDAGHSADGDRNENHPGTEAEEQQPGQQVSGEVRIARRAGEQQRGSCGDGQSDGRDVARSGMSEQMTRDLRASGNGERERQKGKTGLEWGVSEYPLDEDGREE